MINNLNEIDNYNKFLKILSNTLYLKNKKAKEIRDEIDQLKEDLFQNNGILVDCKIFPGADKLRSDEYIEDLEEYLKEIDREEDYIIEQGKLEDNDSYYSEVLNFEIENIEDIYKEKEEVLEEIERVKKLVEEAHEKIKYSGDFKRKQEEIYDLKTKILKKFGEYTGKTHKFKQDDENVYDVYKLGDREFHLLREIEEGENIKDFEELDNIKSEKEDIDKSKIFNSELFNYIANYLSKNLAIEIFK